jgi:hypothetical protein
MNIKSIQRTREITIDQEAEYDLVVCGAGPAGMTAALAARREGLSVLLVEALGQIGGMGTNGLVSHWLSGRTPDCKHWVVGGLFRELSCEASDLGIAKITDLPPGERLSPHGWTRKGKLTAGVPFDPYRMAAFLDDKMAEARVDVLFFTRVVDVNLSLEGDRIGSIILSNKSGFSEIKTSLVIDATGDGDVAALSKCDFVLGREEDNLMTPVTLEMQVSNVDTDALDSYVEGHPACWHIDPDFTPPENYDPNTLSKSGFRWLREIDEMTRRGDWPFSFTRLIMIQLDYPDTYQINTTRMTGYDGTDAASVSQAMAQGRRESIELLEILRKHFVGFENVRLKSIAPYLGVRETRRIIGDFFLRMSDFADERTFDDVVGYACGSWDLPDPHKPSRNPNDGAMAGVKRNILPIPYRIMIPRPVKNLLCAGRCISVERPILGPYRDQAPCMAIGEAAGTAAGLAFERETSFSEIDFAELRTKIRQNGGIVNEAEIQNNPVWK